MHINGLLFWGVLTFPKFHIHYLGCRHELARCYRVIYCNLLFMLELLLIIFYIIFNIVFSVNIKYRDNNNNTPNKDTLYAVYIFFTITNRCFC